MGIDRAVMPLLLSTPADRLRWLTRSELKTTRLATHGAGATDLLIKSSTPVIPAAGRATGENAATKVEP
jgi:hypothetical protein